MRYPRALGPGDSPPRHAGRIWVPRSPDHGSRRLGVGRASFYQQKVLHVAGFLAVGSRPMEELTPEIRHWTAVHPNIGWVVSSYWLPGMGVLLDPLEVPDEVTGIDQIVLSNRHHRRSAFEARERFDAVVRVPRTGLHEFGDDPVEPYELGE